MYRVFTLTGLLLLLTGCSAINGEEGYFRDRARDYYGSHLIAPLDMPAGVEMRQSPDRYPIPHNVPEAVGVVSMEPPGFD